MRNDGLTVEGEVVIVDGGWLSEVMGYGWINIVDG
jgi:hypothetical protein